MHVFVHIKKTVEISITFPCSPVEVANYTCMHVLIARLASKGDDEYYNYFILLLLCIRI